MENKESNLLSCDICFESFNDSNEMKPRLLLCGHSFCTTCLSVLIDGTVELIKCPTCRQQTQVRKVEELKPNFALIELLKSITELEATTLCEECEETHASLWCHSCESNLCSECCTIIHKMKSLRKHKPVKLQDKTVGECEKHAEKLSFFCNDCAVPICNICRDTKFGLHGSHNVILVRESESEQIQKWIETQKLAESMCSELDIICSKVSQTAQDIAQKENDAIKLVNSDFDRIVSAVEQRRTQVLSKIKNDALSTKTKLNTQRSQISLMIASSRTLTEKIRRASERRGVALFVPVKDLMAEFQESIKKYETLDRNPITTSEIHTNLQSKEIIELINSYGCVVVGAQRPEVQIDKAAKTTSSSLELQWKCVSLASDVTDYAVQRKCESEKKESSFDSNWECVASTKNCFQEFKNLEPQTDYMFQVCARTRSIRDNGGWSKEFKYKTKPASLSIVTTQSPRNEGWPHVMFDVKAHKTIHITKLELKPDRTFKNQPVSLYYSPTPHIHIYNRLDSWNLIGSTKLTAESRNLTEIPIQIDIRIPVNQTFALYILAKASFCTSNVEIEVCNSDLTVFPGAARNYLTEPRYYNNRMAHMKLHYTLE